MLRRPVAFLALPLLPACSSAPAGLATTEAPDLDLAAGLRGVPDHGADPAVVLIDVGGQGFCAGALLEEDVVLTARLCVELPAGSPACPATGAQVSGPRDLPTLRVLVGDTTGTAVERARGQDLILPSGDTLCGEDLALLLLDAPIDDVAPLAVSPTGVAAGDHVRAVTIGAGLKLVRDHVPVSAASSREIALAEAPCSGVPGGPVIDESSGDVVGVNSRSGPSCDAPAGWDIATRPDAFFALVQDALARGHVSHASHQAHQKKGPVDVGASCAQASECAAGACVTYAGARYCSETCALSDRCPSGYRCVASQQSTAVCVRE